MHDNRAGCVLGLLAAALVPIILPVIWFSVVSFTSAYPNAATPFLVGIFAFFITVGHIVFLAVPGLLLLRRMGQVKAWTVSLLGFLAGAVPIGIFAWPLKAPRYSGDVTYWNGEQFVRHVPSPPDWTGFAESVLAMGALGLASAAVFWIVANRCVRAAPHDEAEDADSGP